MYSSKSLEATASVQPAAAGPVVRNSPDYGPLTRAVVAALSAPFDVGAYDVTVRAQDALRTHSIVEVEFPAAAVRRRLDAVLGPAGYHEAYAVVDEGIVRCDLTVGGGAAPPSPYPPEEAHPEA